MRTAQFELYGTRLFRPKRHFPLARRSTAWKTEMPIMIFEHRDFSGDPHVAVASDIHECLAVDEDFLLLLLENIV